ncbi:MAG TPA: hypothetical protein VK633_02025, partial [Verrucomicrobiae bacterium]|nr:hypothetical protein [Verrucomicrobiae bacterium]
MASFYDGTDSYHRSKLSGVNRPSAKIMLAEEAEVKESVPQRIGVWDSTSGWEWTIDPLTKRHSKRSTAAFADGHVEKITAEFAALREHYNPME